MPLPVVLLTVYLALKILKFPLAAQSTRAANIDGESDSTSDGSTS